MLANASLEPLLVNYVRTLGTSLSSRDVDFDRLFLMESNGGLMPFSAVTNGGRAVHTLLSGPAAAVQGALALVRTVDQESLITLDIGGTSADIAFVDANGALEVTEGRLVGHDVYVPMLDVTTIGAGGGTISKVNEDGRLLVGPMSAGAVPGPACYGHGGELPTTTDADLVLGLLNPDYYLGGRMTLDTEPARTAIATHVATPLNVDLLAAAAGMIHINDVHMADAIRVYAAQKGIDLSTSTLVPCGGAGPLHAAGVATEIGIRHIIIPPQPGGFSAVGLLCTDVVQDFVQTDITMLSDENAEFIEARFSELADRARAELLAQGFPHAAITCFREVDARYAGQGFELRIPLEEDGQTADPGGLTASFHTRHLKTYGHEATSEPVEIVSYRIRAVVELLKYHPNPAEQALESAAPPRGEHRPIYVAGSWTEALVIRRSELRPGHELAGPVIVEQPDTTSFVPPGWTLRCDEYANLHITRDAAGLTTRQHPAPPAPFESEHLHMESTGTETAGAAESADSASSEQLADQPPSPQDDTALAAEGAEVWQPPRVRKGPVVVVLGIVAFVSLGGAALSLLGGSPKAAPTSPGTPTNVKGQQIAGIPAIHALAPIISGGQPPADVVNSLVVPVSSTVNSSSKLDASVDQYDRGIYLTAPDTATSLVAFYRAELAAKGWSLSPSQPVTSNGQNGTEVLAQRESTDGYYWEVGVIILAANPSLTPALSGAGTTSVSSTIDLRILEVPDGN